MFVHFVLLIYIPIYFDHIGSSHTRSCHSFFPWPHGRVQGSSGVALTKRLGEGLLFGGVADHKTTVHNEIFTYCKLKHIYIYIVYICTYLFIQTYIYIYLHAHIHTMSLHNYEYFSQLCRIPREASFSTRMPRKERGCPGTWHGSGLTQAGAKSKRPT